MNLAINTMLPHSYKSDSPGATVIVTDHGAVVFRKAYGLANVAENVALDPWMSLRGLCRIKDFSGKNLQRNQRSFVTEKP